MSQTCERWSVERSMLPIRATDGRASDLLRFSPISAYF